MLKNKNVILELIKHVDLMPQVMLNKNGEVSQIHQPVSLLILSKSEPQLHETYIHFYFPRFVLNSDLMFQLFSFHL